MLVIDISYAQTTNINFVQLRNAGVEGVILKATGSNTGYRYVDSKYRYFLPRARAAGMRIGHYHFNGYGDPAGDARFFWSNIDYQPGDLIALDDEAEGDMPRWGSGQVNAFHDMAKALSGLVPDTYMSSSVTRADNWSGTVARGSGLWVAQYGTNNGSPQGSPNIAYWPNYKLWQYTSLARLPGYPGYLDANISHPTISWSGGGSKPIPKPKELKVKQYHYEDHDSRNGGRTLQPGDHFYLNTAAGQTNDKASNVVGNVGPYSITPHVYAQGSPGDSIDLTLIQQSVVNGKLTNSPHYTEHMEFGSDGKIQRSVEFKRDVKSGTRMFVKIQATPGNKASVNVTRLDSDAFVFIVA